MYRCERSVFRTEHQANESVLKKNKTSAVDCRINELSEHFIKCFDFIGSLEKFVIEGKVKEKGFRVRSSTNWTEQT